MNEIISNIINTTINSFDFTFCIIVNITTYLIIKWFINKELSTWNKRKIFIIASIILGIIYYFTGSDIKILINSIILAPVSWSWIFKPICSKFNIDYSDANKLN